MDLESGDTCADVQNDLNHDGVANSHASVRLQRTPTLQLLFQALKGNRTAPSSTASHCRLMRSPSLQLMENQARIRDDSEVFTAFLIGLTVVVACCCGIAAYLLHASVGYGGCLGGLNGCRHHFLLKMATQAGISPSMFFTVTCGLSGLVCSLIIYAPCHNGVAKRCKGGGSAGTKIGIASGAKVSGWIVVIRIILATLYMSGGNPLGTEGPIVHLSSSLAMWLVSRLGGHHQRKFLSTFGVIGAAAGISAGFNVLVTGIVYVIEELTRTLSRKLALILAFAAGIAVLVTDLLSLGMEHWFHFHPPHADLVPITQWADMSMNDILTTLLLSLPIGVLSGVAGWLFAQSALALSSFFNSPDVPLLRKRLFPERIHLMLIGIVCGLLGAAAYEGTGMNGVWGTTAGAIPEALSRGLTWQKLSLLFLTKFAAFTFATGGGGPGGTFVPSLVAGGFLGLAVSVSVNANNATQSACAIIGMGSMFSSVMHLPLTGVILMFELTRAEKLLVPIVIANFVASNVVCRLPHGAHSFVHQSLARDSTWLKLHERDFIETDLQETEVNLALFESTIRVLFLTDSERLRLAFDAWRQYRVIAQCEVNAPTKQLSSKSIISSRLSPQHLKEALGMASSRDLEAGEEMTSPFRQDSTWSFHSGFSNTVGQDLELALQVRRQRRELWETLSRVIPGFSLQLWNMLTPSQRVAIAEVASALPRHSTTASDGHSTTCSLSTTVSDESSIAI